MSVFISLVSMYFLDGVDKRIVNAITNISKEDNKKIDIEDVDIPKDIPAGNINETGMKYSISANYVETWISNKKQESKNRDGKKYVFLTFDDGPVDAVTPEVLDVLKEEGVKATFFVVGKKLEESENSKKILKQIYNDGHAIGHHSYTHDTSKLYPNDTIDVEGFMSEIERTNNLMKDIIGEKFESKIIRLPEGQETREYYEDEKLQDLLKIFNENKMYSIDWNSLCADAEEGDFNEKQMLNWVKETSYGREKAIVLLHDTYGKEKTAKALPEIIKYFKDQGYEFKTIGG